MERNYREKSRPKGQAEYVQTCIRSTAGQEMN